MKLDLKEYVLRLISKACILQVGVKCERRFPLQL